MFEVGRTYRITTGIGEAEGYSSYTVVAYEAPLLKVEGAGITTILNTNSPSFVSAELDDPEAREAAHNAFLDSLSDDDKNL